MKISVCGKGGSGKSTVVTLLANEAIARGYKIIVVDSDESNSGLYRMLGFNRLPVPLMELVGGKEGLKQKMRQPNVLAEAEIATTQIPEQHILRKNGLVLVAIGKIMQSLEGCACPMGVLSREFLKKLTLEKDELAIVDMEAGVEHFGRGVETSIDSVLVVVEHPLESLDVAEKIHNLASGIGIRNVWAVLNKVPSDEISAKLETELNQRNMTIAGCIHFDNEVYVSSIDGSVPTDGRAMNDIKDVLEVILTKDGHNAHG